MASLFRPAPFPQSPGVASGSGTQPAVNPLVAAAPFLFGAGTLLTAQAGERAASIENQRLRRLAGSERATSQRAAIEERRRADIVQSRARAVSAASGAGATDPTVLKIMDDLSAEGEYRALTRTYEGETAAQSLELEGAERKRAARGRSISTLLSGASMFASKYGS